MVIKVANFTLITKNFKTVGIKEDIIKAVVERCIQLYLHTIVGPVGVISELQYCPSWKYIRKQKKKFLKGIRIRLASQSSYTEIKDKDLIPTGLSLDEIHEFLKRSSAQKTMID